MEELVVNMYDNEFDEKKGFQVSTRSCGSSESEENSRINLEDFAELGTFNSTAFSPRRIFSDIQSQIRLSKYTRWTPSGKYARIWHILSSVLRVLLPSFILPSQGHQPTRELHASAWLDGLRGTAALFVVFHHTSRAWFSDRAFAGFGSGGDSLNQYIIQLPILRIVISGYPQIAIFFVISGYALSYKPMKLLHSGRSNEFLDSLAMSVFRRHTRLFLPAAGVMLCTAFMTYMDWYGKGGGSREPPHLPTLGAQIWNWAGCVVELAEPFSLRDTVSRYQPPYDMNLWTLPVEFRDSLIVFTTILALSKTRSTVRICLSLGIIGYCLYITYWDIFLFLSGMLLADLKFRRQAQAQAQPGSRSRFSEWEAQHPTAVHRFWVVNFIVALWILGMPEVGRGSGTSPGFQTLTALIPSKYLAAYKPDLFWVPIAAVYVVFVVDNDISLQAIFTNSFAQYIGKISFAMYMVHGPILYSLGWHLQLKTVKWTGSQTDFWYGLGIFLAVLVVFPTIFWVADVVWRLIDMKSVKFARWVSDKVQ
jgi:peptidoglycan/LPS O-acetylase OafA/YrhL